MARTDHAAPTAQLPPGWTTGIDPCSGKRVYVHTLSGKIALRHPGTATIVRETQPVEEHGEEHRGRSADDAASSAVTAAVIPSHNFCLGCGECIEVIRFPPSLECAASSAESCEPRRTSGVQNEFLCASHYQTHEQRPHEPRDPCTPLTPAPCNPHVDASSRVRQVRAGGGSLLFCPA